MRPTLLVGMAALALVLTACGGGGSTSGSGKAAPRPASTAKSNIVEPAAGASIPGGSVTVRLSLDGARVVQASTKDIKPYEGHVHLTVDDKLQSMTFAWRTPSRPRPAPTSCWPSSSPATTPRSTRGSWPPGRSSPRVDRWEIAGSWVRSSLGRTIMRDAQREAVRSCEMTCVPVPLDRPSRVGGRQTPPIPGCAEFPRLLWRCLFAGPSPSYR